MKEFAKQKTGNMMQKTWAFAAIIVTSAVLLSVLTVGVQVETMGIAHIQDEGLGLAYEGGVAEELQITRHRTVLNGTSEDPFQYRLLSEYLVEGVVALTKRLQVPHPHSWGFVIFRVLQNILLFFIAALYYRKLGLDTYIILIALSLLAWGMSHSFYGSDFQFSTYSDVIFYLLAGLVILQKKYVWIIPIAGLAVLNRETSGLIPVMLLATEIFSRRGRSISKRVIYLGAAALALYAIGYLGIRYLLGPRPLHTPHGYCQGWELFTANMCSSRCWFQLLATFGIIPAMALFSIRRWPRILKIYFWTIVPFWFLLHLFVGVMFETRLFLVPLALIFVPGALFGIPNANTKHC